VSALLLASCGGGDDSGGSAKKREPTTTDDAAAQTQPSEPAPSAGGGAAPPPATGAKARYIERVDSICRDLNVRLAPIRSKLARVDDGRRSKGAVFSQFHDLTVQAASISGAGLGQIRGVQPPPGGRTAIQRIQSLLARQVQLLHDLAEAAGRQDAADIKRLNGRLQSANIRYRAAATRFGFKVCGQGR
jgi:hypothetical protein